mmetsp:Transcript_82520/g.220555  ORF Transcript_82520/g.220555 Transcript_82520/m.220555 type:complete len:402 (-) Transcript_82520:2806-4011(-)
MLVVTGFAVLIRDLRQHQHPGRHRPQVALAQRVPPAPHGHLPPPHAHTLPVPHQEHAQALQRGLPLPSPAADELRVLRQGRGGGKQGLEHKVGTGADVGGVVGGVRECDRGEVAAQAPMLPDTPALRPALHGESPHYQQTRRHSHPSVHITQLLDQCRNHERRKACCEGGGHYLLVASDVRDVGHPQLEHHSLHHLHHLFRVREVRHQHQQRLPPPQLQPVLRSEEQRRPRPAALLHPRRLLRRRQAVQHREHPPQDRPGYGLGDPRRAGRHLVQEAQGGGAHVGAGVGQGRRGGRGGGGELGRGFRGAVRGGHLSQQQHISQKLHPPGQHPPIIFLQPRQPTQQRDNHRARHPGQTLPQLQEPGSQRLDGAISLRPQLCLSPEQCGVEDVGEQRRGHCSG